MVNGGPSLGTGPSATAAARAPPLPPLRVALVGQGNFPIPPPGYAPVESHIASLAEALRAAGVDVHVVNRVLPRFKFRLLVHALWVARPTTSLSFAQCHTSRWSGPRTEAVSLQPWAARGSWPIPRRRKR
jgi:hypothetical protein